MARLARVVAPGIPHHITQRGNRRQLPFFREEGLPVVPGENRAGGPRRAEPEDLVKPLAGDGRRRRRAARQGRMSETAIWPTSMPSITTGAN